MLTWSTSLPDWRARIIAGRSLLPCEPLFPEQAEAGLAIFRDLPIVDMIGKPTFGDIGRDWTFDLPRAVFGAYNPETGRREINKFFELIAKKNTKSTRAAGIMLTELVRNERHSAEYVIIAPTIEVAKNSSEPAMDFVAEHPELKKILKPVAHQRLIEHRITGAQLKILAADSETVAGGKSTGVLFDELWLFGKRAHARNRMREAVGGLKSRVGGGGGVHAEQGRAGLFHKGDGGFKALGGLIAEGESMNVCVVAGRVTGIFCNHKPEMCGGDGVLGMNTQPHYVLPIRTGTKTI